MPKQLKLQLAASLSIDSTIMDRDETNQPPPPVAGRYPLIQDVNHYLESNGIILQGGAQEAQQQVYQQLDQVEFAADVTAQKKHQSQIIDKMRKEDDEHYLSCHQESMLKKNRIMEESRGVSISISTTRAHEPHVLKNVPLHDLVDQCDTFLTLASSEHWPSLVEKDQTDYIFSLDQFDTEAVTQFLSIVNRSSISVPTTTTGTATATVQDIPNHHIIECCYIAHYLQAKDVLNDIVDIIQASIDSDNCTSICILADELQIPSLLQSSMRFVMESLDDIQNNRDLWNDIPSTLRNHIITLKNAAHSSIIGSGHVNSRKTLFSSGNEFLAIFHDTLTLNKERLLEAKQRQEEIIKERMMEAAVPGRFSRRFVQQKDVYGGSVKDAAIKIEKQERRVQTLQAFYDQQKAIFSQDAQSGDARFCGSFHL